MDCILIFSIGEKVLHVYYGRYTPLNLLISTNLPPSKRLLKQYSSFKAPCAVFTQMQD